MLNYTEVPVFLSLGILCDSKIVMNWRHTIAVFEASCRASGKCATLLNTDFKNIRTAISGNSGITCTDPFLFNSFQQISSLWRSILAQKIPVEEKVLTLQILTNKFQKKWLGKKSVIMDIISETSKAAFLIQIWNIFRSCQKESEQ